MSLAEIRAFLDKHSLSPSRDLGQNFLVDPREAARLVQLAGVEPEHAVIEIGTGLGILTHALAAKARWVITIEVDSGLVRAHAQEGGLGENVELRHADARKVDLAGLIAGLGAPVKVVANLPYSVSTPLLRRLLDLRGALVDWSVMLQKELGDRLLADPGTRDYGSMGVLHQLLVRVDHLTDVDPQGFYPAPKVVSSFLRMSPLECSLVAEDELLGLERFLRAAFNQRRKTLVNSTRRFVKERGGEAGLLVQLLEDAGQDPRVRAEALSPENLLKLSQSLGRALAAS